MYILLHFSEYQIIKYFSLMLFQYTVSQNKIK